MRWGTCALAARQPVVSPHYEGAASRARARLQPRAGEAGKRGSARARTPALPDWRKPQDAQPPAWRIAGSPGPEVGR